MDTSKWLQGPEELVVATSGGVIQFYPGFKNTVQRYIDHILLRCGPQDGGKSVILRIANDDGIIGVGILAGTAAVEIERIIGSGYEKERRGSREELQTWKAVNF